MLRGVVYLLILGLLQGCFLVQPQEPELSAVPENFCVDVIPDNAYHRVAFCVQDELYQFKVGSRIINADRQTYRLRLKHLIYTWLKGSAFPQEALLHTEIQVWVFAPLFEPHRASTRVVLESPFTNLVIPLELEPERWHIDAEKVRTLGFERFPENHGYALGRLQLVVARGADTAALQNLMGQFPAITAVRASTSLYWLSVPAFQEWHYAQKIFDDRRSRQLIQHMDFKRHSEPAGYLKKVLAMPFFD